MTSLQLKLSGNLSILCMWINLPIYINLLTHWLVFILQWIKLILLYYNAIIRISKNRNDVLTMSITLFSWSFDTTHILGILLQIICLIEQENVGQYIIIYRVSQKKLHLFLEGRSTPKFWARNKSRGCFGILRFSALKCI